MAAELEVVRRMMVERRCIYHFLYGETTYHHAAYWNFRSHRLVASFHWPPNTFREVVAVDDHLKRLTAAVCLGREQQDFFAGIVGPDRAFFAPLGIDTDYYMPSPFEMRDTDLCLVVGSNYRDFATLRGVIELVAYRRPRTRFIVLTSPREAALIGKHPNVTYRSRVEEAEFLRLYHSATLMVMPLLEAVANNALLEGMATGLPVVLTDVGAVRDYATAESAALVPAHDARRMADVVVDLLECEQERRRLSEAARRRSMEFSWPKVVEKLDAVYEAVA
jgi:glycosyltransferase involved in cell wall biosynthesis